MTDAANRQLLHYLATATGPTLWCADEHIDAATVGAVAPRPDLRAMSNRSDVVAALRARGVEALLADFDAAPPQGLRRVAFRIAKEKALVHYIINRALELLPPGGEWPKIVVASLLATASLWLLGWAYAHGDTGYLAMTEYSSFVYAAALGWLVFGEILSPYTLIGAAVIVAACLWAARAPARQPAAVEVA